MLAETRASSCESIAENEAAGGRGRACTRLGTKAQRRREVAVQRCSGEQRQRAMKGRGFVPSSRCS
jgi:hypothetical protein